MDVGVLYSRIRKDEKLLLEELRARDHDVRKVDVRRTSFHLDRPPIVGCDVVVNRCLATSRGRYTAALVQRSGIPVVNPARTLAVCGDKVATSLALEAADVPTPRTAVAFDRQTALETVEAMGYPVVLKPVVGSWGRLVAKLDSRTAAEAVLEHKEVLGHYEHRVFYLQEFVDKPDRDIRIVAAGGEPIAGMVRTSDHWRTNAATGAETEPFEVDRAAADLVGAASAAVGGGLLGIDLMETDGTEPYTVHEVNGVTEFKTLHATVDVDVPAAIVDWLEGAVEGSTGGDWAIPDGEVPA